MYCYRLAILKCRGPGYDRHIFKNMAITITERAKNRIRDMLAKSQATDHYLKIALQGGGCSGLKYQYEILTVPAEKDKVFEFEDVKICIDGKSYLFLNGSEIDYKDDLLKSGLVFNNPHAKRTCGCGESFTF